MICLLIVLVVGGSIFMRLKKIGLVPKLIVAIILGILIGQFLPVPVIKVFVTFAGIFSNFLKFIVPLMIVGFVVKGIADLTQGAGKLLGIATGLSYFSTILAGSGAYFVAFYLFPKFMDSSTMSTIVNPENSQLDPFFEVAIPPFIDVTSAIIFAFIMGLCISTMRGKELGNATYNIFSEFSEIIVKVLKVVIIPFLPLFILGTFANMTYSGEVYAIISVLWKVFLVVLSLHLIYIGILFVIAGVVSKKNPLVLMRNQIPGYLTAIGTQSSAATIPVNLKCAEKNGTTKQISEFIIPLCSTIHMPGSIITITCCVTSVLMMFNMPFNFSTMFPLILSLGVAMVAAPGAPGGSIMAALPFLTIVGISPESSLASLLIALYITQDSFGTAANVSGDNAMAIIVDTIYKKFILKKESDDSSDKLDQNESAKEAKESVKV